VVRVGRNEQKLRRCSESQINSDLRGCFSRICEGSLKHFSRKKCYFFPSYVGKHVNFQEEKFTFATKEGIP